MRLGDCVAPGSLDCVNGIVYVLERYRRRTNCGIAQRRLHAMKYERVEVPVSDELLAELIEFWRPLAGAECEAYRGVLSGQECAYNEDVVYLAREDGRLAGTTHLTIPRTLPGLGGFGEVQTAPPLRRRGVAGHLCREAVGEMRERNGKAIFLGTGNPGAARIYHRLGWRKLAGAAVMANVLSGESPEALLVEYFQGGGAAGVVPASPAERIAMIPLLVCPHDWQVLDANAGMSSTRYAVQHSCMGLYGRYEPIAADGKGAWFAARTGENKAVGLSSARLDEHEHCRVDGFVHGLFGEVWPEIIRAAVRWGGQRGASMCYADVSVEDEQKRSWFESLGFGRAGAGKGFDLDGRQVASVRMERAPNGIEGDL